MRQRSVQSTKRGQYRACLIELSSLQYADKLYGPEFGDSEDTLGDIDDQIAKEVAALRDRKDGQERRFQSVATGTKNVVFIACRGAVDPNRLIHETLCDIRDSKIQKSRCGNYSVKPRLCIHCTVHPWLSEYLGAKNYG